MNLSKMFSFMGIGLVFYPSSGCVVGVPNAVVYRSPSPPYMDVPNGEWVNGFFIIYTLEIEPSLASWIPMFTNFSNTTLDGVSMPDLTTSTRHRPSCEPRVGGGSSVQHRAKQGREMKGHR